MNTFILCIAIYILRNFQFLQNINHVIFLEIN